MDVERLYQGVQQAMQKIRSKRQDSPEFEQEQKLLQDISPILTSMIMRDHAGNGPTKCKSKVSSSPYRTSPVSACLGLPDGTEFKLIGQGYFGQVFKVDLGRNKPVAVKIENMDNPYWTQRLTLSEKTPADILCKATGLAKRAGEAGIGPKIHAHFTCIHAKNTLYVTVMDLLVGSSLADWMQKVIKHPKSNSVIKKVRAKFESKLKKLTSMKILHNDLYNPQNVFVEHQEDQPERVRDVKLVDFGLSTTIDDFANFQGNNIRSLLGDNSLQLRVLRHLVSDKVVVV